MIFIILSVLLLCGSSFGQIDFQNVNSRIIVNGRNAVEGEFPYQVSIQEKFYYIDGARHICGAVIIDEYHVLTAAHCLYGRYLPMHFIAAGTRDLSFPNDPNRVNVTMEQLYQHEDYVHFYYINDIAIVRVSPGFPLDSDFISPVPMLQEMLKDRADCVVSGWGTLAPYPNEEYPDILQALDLPFLTYEECRALYAEYGYFEPGMLCAGYIAGLRDSCSGDSGGPLVCNGLLTGIVSWGESCALPFFPGVYADVAYYKDWIQSTLARSYQDAGLPQRRLR